MYKYYKKDYYKIMQYEFDSISEFIDYLDTAPINKWFSMEGELASEEKDYEFCGTKTLEEAKELCKFGYHEDFDRLVDLKLTLEKYIKYSEKKSKQYNYYVGYAPDVKAYLEGNPLSMLNREYPKYKHIDIYYNAANLARVDQDQIFNRGAVTLCLVEILESMGFGVDLKIFLMSSEHEQIHYAKFNLKQPGERLNIQKLYFPLCHPSFLRRLGFRLKEQTPDISRSWVDGYGRTCDDYTIRQVLDLKENDIVICQAEEMGVKGYDIIDDANAMFEYINKFTNEEVKLEHIKRLRNLYM